MSLPSALVRKCRKRVLAVRRNPLFDADHYVEQYPEFLGRSGDAYRHWRTTGWRSGATPNPLFDTEWYVATYPDVPRSGMNPLDHYLLFGVSENRNPGPRFNTRQYLADNRDVADTGQNPLLHYLRHGMAEGRSSGVTGVSESEWKEAANARSRAASFLIATAAPPNSTALALLPAGGRLDPTPHRYVSALEVRISKASVRPTLKLLAQIHAAVSVGATSVIVVPRSVDESLRGTRLTTYLQNRCRVTYRSLLGVVYEAASPSALTRALEDVTEQLAWSGGGTPTVLNLMPPVDSQLDDERGGPDYRIVTGDSSTVGAFADDTFEVVLLGGGDPASAAIARRLSSGCVVTINGDTAAVEWKSEPPARRRVAQVRLAADTRVVEHPSLAAWNDDARAAVQPAISGRDGGHPERQRSDSTPTIDEGPLRPYGLDHVASTLAASEAEITVVSDGRLVFVPGSGAAVARALATEPSSIVSGLILTRDGEVIQPDGIVCRDPVRCDPEGPDLSHRHALAGVHPLFFAGPTPLLREHLVVDPSISWPDTLEAFGRRLRDEGVALNYVPEAVGVLA